LTALVPTMGRSPQDGVTRIKGTLMSYEILGNDGEYWTCGDSAWRDYLKIETAFGWVSEGAFFKNDELGFGPHPSGSYLGNDWQLVTDDDARAFGAALHLAILNVNAGAPMTDNQVTALKAFEIKAEDEFSSVHPDQLRTIRTRQGTFDIEVRWMRQLANVVSAGGFTIA
jgi:hypothetical protein